MSDRDLEFWDGSGTAFRAIVRSWPEAARLAIGADLRRVQRGDEPVRWKALKNFCIAAYELRHACGARVVYSLAFTSQSGLVFVADAFMKDSRERSEMRRDDRERIEKRLKAHRARYLTGRRSIH